LDTNLTPELLEEGFVRELISKIQTMRKEAGFEVTDKITITYQGSEKAEAVLAKHDQTIGAEVLASSVTKMEKIDLQLLAESTDSSTEEAVSRSYVKEWKINGEQVVLRVERV